MLCFRELIKNRDELYCLKDCNIYLNKYQRFLTAALTVPEPLEVVYLNDLLSRPNTWIGPSAVANSKYSGR